MNEYETKLLDRNLPVLRNIEDLSKLVDLNEESLASMAFGADSHYRTFTIPKRSGGNRIISAPYPALLHTQKWIATQILARQPIHDSAHGYVTGRSILTNAAPHCGRQSLLKIDIRNFFPTINLARSIGLFSSLGYSRPVALVLAKLTTYKNELPQGSAASPSISNNICWGLDTRLCKFSESRNLAYTRYADDLCFSGRYINQGSIKIIQNIINDEGFIVNEDKTKLIRGNGRKVVTGVSVAGNQPKLPHPLKRKWRAEIYSCVNLGIIEHCAKYGLLEFGYRASLIGKVAHWAALEPDNAYPRKMLPLLKELVA